MCCKVFEYEFKDGSSIYLNASDSVKCTPELVLNLYVTWYNKDFAPFENLTLIKAEDFKFIGSFCPIDFYDESSKIVREL